MNQEELWQRRVDLWANLVKLIESYQKRAREELGDAMVNVSLFSLGQIMTTPGALNAFERMEEDPATYLTRHNTGDWGNLDEHDRQENEYSLGRHLRLFSAYNLSDGTRLWIITEADRSMTTFLLPDEY